jgi:hypothetical protein
LVNYILLEITKGNLTGLNLSKAAQVFFKHFQILPYANHPCLLLLTMHGNGFELMMKISVMKKHLLIIRCC